MAEWGEETERAFRLWGGKQGGGFWPSAPVLRERRCVHSAGGAEGAPYPGVDYLRGLQALRGSQALRAARAVDPFFWADAPRTWVWLCEACAVELGLG